MTMTRRHGPRLGGRGPRRAGGECAHASPPCPAPACCRWSKLTATDSAPSRSARALEPLDPWGFGVATVEEGHRPPGGGHHAADARRYSRCCPPDWTQCARARSPALDRRSCDRSRPGSATRPALSRGGRHRHGARRACAGTMARPSADVARLLAAAAGWEGVYTHFHSADSRSGSPRRCSGSASSCVLSDAAAAPAAGACRQQRRRLRARATRRTWSGPGIFLYGGSAGEWHRQPVAAPPRARGRRASAAPRWLRELRRHLAAPRRRPRLRLSASATPTGCPVRLSSHGAVEIQGRRLPDRRASDDGHDDDRVGWRRLGDVATVFGGLVTLDQQAVAAGTISYELLDARWRPGGTLL